MVLGQIVLGVVLLLVGDERRWRWRCNGAQCGEDVEDDEGGEENVTERDSLL